MQGGTQTSVTAVLVAGAISTILMWLLRYFAPDLMATAPETVEQALGVLFTAVLCFFLPAWGTPATKPPADGVGRIIPIALLVGMFCALPYADAQSATPTSCAHSYFAPQGMRTIPSTCIDVGDVSLSDGAIALPQRDMPSRGCVPRTAYSKQAYGFRDFIYFQQSNPTDVVSFEYSREWKDRYRISITGFTVYANYIEVTGSSSYLLSGTQLCGWARYRGTVVVTPAS